MTMTISIPAVVFNKKVVLERKLKFSRIPGKLNLMKIPLQKLLFVLLHLTTLSTFMQVV